MITNFNSLIILLQFLVKMYEFFSKPEQSIGFFQIIFLIKCTNLEKYNLKKQFWQLNLILKKRQNNKKKCVITYGMLDMLVEESLLSDLAELNPLEELVRFEPTTTTKKEFILNYHFK